VVDVGGGEVADGPVGHAQAHVCPQGCQDVRGDVVEELVEMGGGGRVGGGGVDAEAQGDQVQVPVAARGAVPVDDAGDVAAAGEDVAGVVVAVDGVIAAQAAGVARPGGGDPAVQRLGAAAVLAQWLVQAVAGPVAGEVEIGGRDGRVAGELACLQVVEGGCPAARSAPTGGRRARSHTRPRPARRGRARRPAAPRQIPPRWRRPSAGRPGVRLVATGRGTARPVRPPRTARVRARQQPGRDPGGAPVPVYGAAGWNVRANTSNMRKSASHSFSGVDDGEAVAVRAYVRTGRRATRRT